MQTYSTNTQNKKTKTLISFIITFYNESIDMLQECIDSIYNISLDKKEREIILINDGSEINPTPLLNKNTNIRYYKQKNMGVSQARNTGVNLATGKYIQFIDADDFLIVPAYNTIINILKVKKPNILFFRFTNNEKKYKIRSSYKHTNLGAEYMYKNNIRASVCTYLVKQELAKNILFTKGIDYCEDEEFTAKLILKANNIIDTLTVAYFYREHPKSCTHKTDREHVSKRFNNMLEVIISLNKLQPKNKLKQKAIKRRINQLTMDFIFNLMLINNDTTVTENYIKKLTKLKLFPLPKKNYTLKYFIFRITTNTKLFRNILTKILHK